VYINDCIDSGSKSVSVMNPWTFLLLLLHEGFSYTSEQALYVRVDQMLHQMSAVQVDGWNWE
jgi:hypothetical protein